MEVELVEAYVEKLHSPVKKLEINSSKHFKYLILYQISREQSAEYYLCNEEEKEKLLSHYRKTGILRLKKPWIPKVEEINPINVGVYEIKDLYKGKSYITYVGDNKWN
jgi:hypothetical protein